MIQGYTSCSICPELTALCCWWIHSAHPVNLRTGLAMVLLFNVAGTWQQFSRHLPLRALVLWEMNSLLTVWVRGPLRLRDQSHQPLLWVTLEKTQWWKLCPVSPIGSEEPLKSQPVQTIVCVSPCQAHHPETLSLYIWDPFQGLERWLGW